jgi:hypothetical protein
LITPFFEELAFDDPEIRETHTASAHVTFHAAQHRLMEYLNVFCQDNEECALAERCGARQHHASTSCSAAEQLRCRLTGFL